MKKIAFFVTALVGFQSAAMACECLSFSNPQQSALYKDVVVAKVKTQSVDANTGEGVVEIEKFYKGNITDKVIKVAGDDGFSCTGAVLDPSVNSWVALIYTSPEGNAMVACGNSALNFDATGKIEVNLGADKLALSEPEFLDFINRKIVPTVKSLNCWTQTSRFYMDQTGKQDPNDFYLTDEVPMSNNDPLNVELVRDMSVYGLVNSLVARANIFQSGTNNASYYLSATLAEPFFAVTTSTATYVDITKPIMPLWLSLDAYKNLQGVSKDDFGSEPYYSYSAGLSCNVQLGAPLSPIQE